MLKLKVSILDCVLNTPLNTQNFTKPLELLTVGDSHCVKSVCVLSFSGLYFPRISPYSV